MRVWRSVILLLAGVLCLAVGALAFLLTLGVSAPQLPASTGAQVQPQTPVKTLFLGTSSMLWTDGKTHWMLDGFLSRQAVLDVALRPIQVDSPRVDATAQAAFKALNIPPVLAGVLVAHSHYDHSLDAPYLVKKYGGEVYGSGSTQNIALGQGLPADQIQLLGDGATVHLGDFTLQAVRSAHAPTGFTGGFNTQPLLLPAHALAFKEGVSYMFVVSHSARPGKPLAIIQPSAGFVPGQTRGIETELVFLGVGGLGKLKEAEVEAYWTELVVHTRAKRVAMIHWDDFTQPLLRDGKVQALVPMPRLMDNLQQSTLILQRLAERDGVELSLLQAFEQRAF